LDEQQWESDDELSDDDSVDSNGSTSNSPTDEGGR
jgi:hypothetical protein